MKTILFEAKSPSFIGWMAAELWAFLDLGVVEFTEEDELSLKAT